MTFNRHSNLEGKHAFLSPSKYHWINYTPDKLKGAYLKHMAATRGSELHALAKECIRLGVKLPRTKETLNLYVNDAIKYGMTPEQPLYFSENCFGTADAISFDGDVLRIHDLKTGESPTHMEQLMVYAAIFCLEYKLRPEKFDTELRIYQNDVVVCHTPSYEEIHALMQVIIEFDKQIESMKGAGSNG